MRRKRRRIQYYSGDTTTARLRDRTWFPFVVAAATAIVLALIVGAILGAVAGGSQNKDVPRRDLIDFGGAEQPEVKYAELPSVQAGWIDLSGMDSSALRSALKECEVGNAVAFVAYDGKQTVYFNTSLPDKTATSLVKRSEVTAADVVKRTEAEDYYSIALFTVGALNEHDEQLRLIKTSQELALINELASAGIDEIVLCGLPTDSDDLEDVNRYVRQAFEVVGNTRLGVAVSHEDALTSGISRLVGATNAYADSYVLDLRDAENADNVIEKNAYFLTAYRMRLMLRAEEELPTVIEQYSIESYLLVK